MYRRYLLGAIVLLTSGCTTLDTVRTDYKIANEYEKIAEREKNNSNRQAAIYWDKEAQKKRTHDTDDVARGIFYSLFIEKKKKDESFTW
jgi:hypothetical protein